VGEWRVGGGRVEGRGNEEEVVGPCRGFELVELGSQVETMVGKLVNGICQKKKKKNEWEAPGAVLNRRRFCLEGTRGNKSSLECVTDSNSHQRPHRARSFPVIVARALAFSHPRIPLPGNLASSILPRPNGPTHSTPCRAPPNLQISKSPNLLFIYFHPPSSIILHGFNGP
jgi:hypothetical protein